MAVSFSDSRVFLRSGLLKGPAVDGSKMPVAGSAARKATPPRQVAALLDPVNSYGAPVSSYILPDPVARAAAVVAVDRALSQAHILDLKIPALASLYSGREFLAAALDGGLAPDRVEASEMGGIGITFSTQRREAYLECSNSGQVLLALEDKQNEEGEPRVSRVGDRKPSEISILIATFLSE